MNRAIQKSVGDIGNVAVNTKRLQQNLAHSFSSEASIDDRPKLTAREYEIARLVAKGLPNKTIAAILEISPYTVQTHLKRAYCKFNVKTRAAMIAQLMQVSFKTIS